jgi:hypothetical protein
VARGARFLALIALPLLLACGGGGGGGGGGPTQPPPPSITFTASSTGPGIVLAQGAATSASTLVLEVRASQVSGLYGIAFDLDYPSAVLHYATARAGTFLTQGGAQISTQVAETAPGHLVVGVSRIGPVAGATGSGVVLELDFTATAAGSGGFTFSKNSAYRADGSVVSLTWGAGTVAVVR